MKMKQRNIDTFNSEKVFHTFKFYFLGFVYILGNMVS